MSLDPKSLELFVRVAALGAIGKAGAELGLSRTAATQRIQDLEKAVGAQLLHRTTRTVSLSVDGEIFLGHAPEAAGPGRADRGHPALHHQGHRPRHRLSAASR